MTSKDENYKKGKRGELLVAEYFASQGYEVTHVSKLGRGYHWDLEVLKDGETLTIEVKSSKYEFAVPDLSEKQIIVSVHNGFLLTADELWIVGNIEKENPILWKLTKNQVEYIGSKGGIKPIRKWNLNDNLAREHALKM